MDIPRKQASRTVLVKKVKKSTCAGNQRMQASSRNRISQLTRNKYPVARTLEVGAGARGSAWLLSLVINHCSSKTCTWRAARVNAPVPLRHAFSGRIPDYSSQKPEFSASMTHPAQHLLVSHEDQ